MNHGLSDKVRAVAEEEFVFPALRSGKTHFDVAVRDLMEKLQTKGFPARNWPQICTAIQAEKFLRANGLKIESVEGPPSKLSTTVVVRYRVLPNPNSNRIDPQPGGAESAATVNETPEEWAHRMTGRLFGLLREEITSMGGTKAFMRWVRSDDEDEAA